MKRVLLFASMLAAASAAQAQDCAGGAPVIQRIDATTVDRPTATTAVIQLDVVALSGNGLALSYAFSGDAGAIASDGAQATWNVEGDGPFTAEIEVAASGQECVARASVTYRPEAAPAGSDEGESTEEPSE